MYKLYLLNVRNAFKLNPTQDFVPIEEGLDYQPENEDEEDAFFNGLNPNKSSFPNN